MDYAALKTELTTDPNGYGYATPYANGSDWKLADMLNKTRSAIQIDQKTVSVDEFKDAIDVTEYKALTAASRDQLAFITQGDNVKVKGAKTRAMLTDLFPLASAPNSYAALLALRTRDGSRAEQLFGEGTSVTAEDIAKARQA